MMENKYPISHAVGNKIRNIRKNKGITTKHLSDHLGVSQQHLLRLERGLNRLDVDTLVKISLYLETSISEILKEATDHNDETNVEKLFSDYWNNHSSSVYYLTKGEKNKH